MCRRLRPGLAASGAQVLADPDKANTHWQQQHPPAERRRSGTSRPYHTGNLEAYRVTGNAAYRRYLRFGPRQPVRATLARIRRALKYNYGGDA